MHARPADLRGSGEAREALVYEHMETENRHQFDATPSTSGHPRGEIPATGQAFGGADGVAAYYRTSRTDFPGRRDKVPFLRRAKDAAFAESGPTGIRLYGSPPTGLEFTRRTAAPLLSEGGQPARERIHSDSPTIPSPLGFVPGPPLST
ncbi:hypothetical protein [Streptomyces sp. NPDC051219]|uniref:hypothetical protein n=1 Tax=Streptomyces sp. NPDC051219 TaxID=3155283 RepID=UPI0034349651